MQNLFEELKSRIDAVVMNGKIPEDAKAHKGFSEWNSKMTSKNHQPVVQVQQIVKSKHDEYIYVLVEDYCKSP